MNVSYKVACVMQELKDVTMPFMEFRQEPAIRVHGQRTGGSTRCHEGVPGRNQKASG